MPPCRRALRYNDFWHPLPLGVCDTPLRTPLCMYGRIAYAPCQKSFPLQSLTHARPTIYMFRSEPPNPLVPIFSRAAIPRTRTHTGGFATAPPSATDMQPLTRLTHRLIVSSPHRFIASSFHRLIVDYLDSSFGFGQ